MDEDTEGVAKMVDMSIGFNFVSKGPATVTLDGGDSEMGKGGGETRGV